MAAEADPFWLGRALVAEGALSEEHLASARQAWRRNPQEPFALVLEKLGLAEPRRLAELIARRHRLPEARLNPAAFSRAAARLLPEEAARRKCVLGFAQEERRLQLAVADPARYGPADARSDFPGYEVSLHVAPQGEILALLEEAWGPPPAAEAGAGELFGRLLRGAVAEGASDLHLEPRERSLEVRHRVDGRLAHRRFIEGGVREAVVQAAKLAGRMDIAEKRLPQDGQGALQVGARLYHLRFSCLPGVHGESIVVRIIDEHAGVRSFEEMGLDAAEIARLRRLLALPHGLIYVTGPTGSGKTTLLYSMLNSLPAGEINELKIITLEEPVEIRHPRAFLQVEVADRIGRTFGEVLRHALRHDPDVLLVGETRDRATAETTLKASLTGHLCLSTLHTGDALGAVARLRDLGLDPLLLAEALKGVIAQRLVRLLCERCRVPHPQRREWAARLRELPEAPEGRFFAAAPDRACPLCQGRGYRGRSAIVEVFPLAGLERRIAEAAPAAELLRELRARGCGTLYESGLRKAAAGLTTPEEICAAVEAPARGCYDQQDASPPAS
ncbi:MAG TPA: GspE/PulE family protein [Opitutaceae bacterium]|nr:GspE/PulE family protein [Opitutaceae bacterium]